MLVQAFLTDDPVIELVVFPRYGDVVDPHLKYDRNERGADLCCELDESRDPEYVVEDADDYKYRSADPDGPKLRRRIAEDEGRDGECRKDRSLAGRLDGTVGRDSPD